MTLGKTDEDKNPEAVIIISIVHLMLQWQVKCHNMGRRTPIRFYFIHAFPEMTRSEPLYSLNYVAKNNGCCGCLGYHRTAGLRRGGNLCRTSEVKLKCCRILHQCRG